MYVHIHAHMPRSPAWTVSTCIIGSSRVDTHVASGSTHREYVGQRTPVPFSTVEHNFRHLYTRACTHGDQYPAQNRSIQCHAYIYMSTYVPCMQIHSVYMFMLHRDTDRLKMLGPVPRYTCSGTRACTQARTRTSLLTQAHGPTLTCPALRESQK